MTPPDLPLDEPLDDDALAVHAVVDDEATTEQRRRVARDPELVAQVAALREVIAAVAEPVEPPPADVLADLRRRALDARDETPAEPDPEDGDGSAPDPAPPPPLPIRDLGAARARRARSLPPLPAVAAVVILLVVVGVGLLVAGTGGQDADQSSADGGAPTAEGSAGQAESGGDGGSDDAAAEEAPTAAADSDQTTVGEAEDRPADRVRDELLQRATASYATQAALEADLRQVDVDTFTLSGSAAPETGQEEDDGEASTTTSPPTTAPVTGQTSAFAFAADPVATRCDTVLRSAEPELEAAIAAVLVAVDGEPVLVLSNPTEVTDQAPAGIRLTVLNAVDCSPRSAVLR
jgi:hypothetical protein